MSSEQTAQQVRTDRIIVGVDGSEPSKQALRWAQAFASAAGGRIEAVMVTPTVPPYAWAGAFWGAAPGEPDPDAVSEKILTATVDAVFGADRPAGLELTVVRGGGAAEVLVHLSRAARLIVVGSRGHGGFTGLLIGSVSAAVAEHAECPVLVVHGDDAPFPAAAAEPTAAG